jgi:hypothetical protein
MGGTVPQGAIAVPLGRSDRIALVDAADFERVTCWRWNLKRACNGRYLYAQRSVTDGAGGYLRTITLGRFVLNCPPLLNVIYKDGDGLNCRRDNLSLATTSQRTARARRTNRTGFRGVYGIPSGRFCAQISIDGRLRSIGHYDTAEAAARAYDGAARKLFGEHATLNFPAEAA